MGAVNGWWVVSDQLILTHKTFLTKALAKVLDQWNYKHQNGD